MTGVDKQIFQLNKVVTAPGAYKLPDNVSALKLRFKDSGNRSQTKLFWTHSLPTLQFWNPSVAMSVSRVQAPKEKSVGPTVTITRTDGSEETISIASMFWEKMAETIAEAAGATPVSAGELKKYSIPFVTDYDKKMELAKKTHLRDVAFAQKVELHKQQEADREALELAAKEEAKAAAQKKKDAMIKARKEGRVYIEGEENEVKEAAVEVEQKVTEEVAEDGAKIEIKETEVKIETKN
ncbi:YALI0F17600p [Yarrowia lipolytica CLIB122]|uniref:YALI0F17600p n=2 Tax=Yarrowia lipolytica TaxID=4952 RepID=Q6C1B9_YARLI|nr:YALI0F17600p [Yarrowia lipolytica CLIB122]KAJ8055579.1 hypothetical protein LXG23DRAFT_47594 [Yarrowia lipolytica]CAG78352.1 YALI0F17600p [Yarrowia lipolytica CLIB122]VBB82785.1 Conserved hypothetical protein [Yarrowia lipolytica]|eukprot:XP_505543.1 YALI0F17600p [Yarrowia lipolytica CLIB122]